MTAQSFTLGESVCVRPRELREFHLVTHHMRNLRHEQAMFGGGSICGALSLSLGEGGQIVSRPVGVRTLRELRLHR